MLLSKQLIDCWGSHPWSQKNCKTTFLPQGWHEFLVCKRDLIFLLGTGCLDMLHIGRARHPGPVAGKGPQGHLSVEFVNVGGRLTYGGLALDLSAQYIGHQLRRAGSSVGLGACMPGSDPRWSCWVGVVSLLGAPTPEFREFFRLGRAMRVTILTGDGDVVHLFVVCGYQGAEEDSDKFLLADRLFNAVPC